VTDASVRLASVDAVRAHQRAWLEETRERVAADGHFAICNADDFEEVLTAFDVPALVINYWNSVVSFSARKGPHFSEVLKRHGYPPWHFALGLATALEPADAPWGGLPKPTMIVGTTRDEAQLRVTELWARAYGCECVPVDFSWVSQFSHPLPDDWWAWHRDRGDALVDPARVELRLRQLQGLIVRLEALLGRRFEPDRFRAVMVRLNDQMDAWSAAMDLIAAARPLPVSLRDQMAMYQTVWQRGTKTNLRLVESFLAEVRTVVDEARRAHTSERLRIYLATSGNDPAYHDYLRTRWGAAIVSNRYSAIAPMYARSIAGRDPLRELARRQLFLFDKEPHWEVHEAKRWGADVLIAIEADTPYVTRYRRVVEAAGLTYLPLQDERDTPGNRERIDRVLGSLLQPLDQTS
jgi:benzoyl-CoA reductase subunit B